MRGIRARLTVTLVALVALTVVLLGVGAYLFVDNSLRAQALREAATQARFDLSVTIPNARLPSSPNPDDITSSRLLDTFFQRDIGVIFDLGPNRTAVNDPVLVGVLPTLPADLRQRVANGELAYAWVTLHGEPRLVIAGRISQAGAAVYFFRDVKPLEDALSQLRLALIVGSLIVVLLALLVARYIARGVLAPVEAAGRAAEQIERGDLSARVPVTSDDEFGTWAERFNRMAEALADTIGRLEAAEAQNRRFVADVAHELRTPLAALVAEASILRVHLDDLPVESRRAAELLVGDVGRLRILVDDLMEVSRFDAHAEQTALEPVDLAALVRTVAAARLPEATLDLPSSPVVIETEGRRLERIFGNLLDNARQHAVGAQVEVQLTAVPEAVVIAVADRGPGVPADRLPRIFERFYKADPSRHDGTSGLGLAIAAEHAALLGGYLAAANREGGGLRIELWLPVTGSLLRSDGTAIGIGHGGTSTHATQENEP
ncbi:MAG TPA: ATP-binding protein [Candidatus Limnocylindrales bacterium]|nr:ATP-binding protein [Candidatus Limnocylindrales bacterium]